MEKERKIKTLSLVALLVAVLGLTVAFAAMSRTLTINGTATIDAAKWDIHFANLGEAQIGGHATAANTAAIQEDTTVIDGIDITLTRPGDSVTYTFDVVNAGTIDAKVSSFTKNALPTCTGKATDATKKANDEAIICNSENLTYSITYADGTAIAENDELLHGQTKSLKLTLAYKDTATVLPSDDVDLSGMTATVVYVQK